MDAENAVATLVKGYFVAGVVVLLVQLGYIPLVPTGRCREGTAMHTLTGRDFPTPDMEHEMYVAAPVTFMPTPCWRRTGKP